MTLTDLLSQAATLTDAEAKGYALVFDQAAYDVLIAAQEQQPNAQHRVGPVQLTDGRWMLCADLLTEIGPKGLYAEGFKLLSADLFDQVEVIDWVEAVKLIP